jgi:hypothetical protein
VRRQAAHSSAQLALSSNIMAKIIFKITRIAALVSFGGYRYLQLKYNVEDKVFEKRRADELLKDTRAFISRWDVL